VSVVTPGEHGGDGRLVAASLGMDPRSVLDLSVSLNPFAPDPTALLRRHLEAGVLGRYPDAAERAVATAALAGALGVEPGRVLLTNGGAEAIALVAAELVRGWAEESDFSLYRRHLSVLDPAGPRFRSDPHNPSGLLAALGSEGDVWDEAFYPLATGHWTAERSPGSIVLGSLTKLFACPGLRIGFVVVPEDDGERLGAPNLTFRLSRRQPAWSVGALALAALPDLLDAADLRGWAGAIATARAELMMVLRSHGLAPLDSDANYVLVPDAVGVRDALARQAVVVRDCASFGLPGHVRIAVPDEGGLERLDGALARSAAVFAEGRR